jgi:uncharacterized protein DUF4404
MAIRAFVLLRSKEAIMDMPDPANHSESEVRSRLRNAAGLVQKSDSLDPDVRQTLSELLDELGRALETHEAPTAEIQRLAEGATHLAESLHRRHDQSILKSARDRLDSLLLQAESHAPTAVGLARNVTDRLANLGI